MKDKKNKNEGLSWSATFAIAVGIAVVVNSALIVNAYIPSSSMENTFKPGDRVLGNRLSYLLSDPQRFDVIVFKYPDDETKNFTKRIIGLPGEKVEIIDGKVFINDNETPLEDSFIPEEMIGSYGPYYVPEDSYFVLGDNRNHSNDSRGWINTFVKKDQIIGKPGLIYWPLSRIGIVK